MTSKVEPGATRQAALRSRSQAVGLSQAASALAVGRLRRRMEGSSASTGRSSARVVHIFPHAESCLRLVRALAIEMRERGWRARETGGESVRRRWKAFRAGGLHAAGRRSMRDFPACRLKRGLSVGPWKHFHRSSTVIPWPTSQGIGVALCGTARHLPRFSEAA